MCARTAAGIHRTAGKKMGMLLFRGREVKGSEQPQRTELAPPWGVLPVQHQRHSEHCREKKLPQLPGDPSQGHLSIQGALPARTGDTAPAEMEQCREGGRTRGHQLPACSTALSTNSSQIPPKLAFLTPVPLSAPNEAAPVLW